MNLWKVKQVKPIQEQLYFFFYLQVITNAYVKMAVLEICSEKRIRESLVGTLYMYSSSLLLILKRCFCRILSTNFWKKLEHILEKIYKKRLSNLAYFGQ